MTRRQEDQHWYFLLFLFLLLQVVGDAYRQENYVLFSCAIHFEEKNESSSFEAKEGGNERINVQRS